MRIKRQVIICAAVAATALTLASCGDDSAQSNDATPTTSAAAPSPADSTPAQSHNDADVTFAQGMIPHHQQAIEMSDMLLAKQGIDQQVVSLAEAIKAAQGPEIQTMQGWLAEWGASATTTAPPGNMPNMPGNMPNMPGHDMGNMPGHDMGNMGGHGMMSEQDMAALQNAQGVEAAKLFLTQMIEHHKGAITMSQTEVDNGQFAPAVELARSIISSQQQEIDKMQQMLNSL